MQLRKESEEILHPTQQLNEIIPTFLFNDIQDQVVDCVT
jgi:hypothetical protein